MYVSVDNLYKILMPEVTGSSPVMVILPRGSIGRASGSGPEDSRFES